MIGLSLVTTGYVVGESIKSSLGDLIDSSVSPRTTSSPTRTKSGLTPTLADDLAATGNFDAVAGMRYTDVRLGDDVEGGDRHRPVLTIDALFNIDVTDGCDPRHRRRPT